ncbi:efflux RND transporter periplasmic adaptor subunit [Alteromonas sediminis]|uniref:Efflux RND transporter periplasmic adaptor subunit n=1 Tax=Alteromonas sediminis TaxID=2259342 RepID=A0A3N5YLC5_9ALTE|nr:efflux RND transporter periplasmic adaptor subunit [Alteromonas sediminis]RPJ65891.1 efflux RND transporter periplasmic adaptor subunit [Alteromonas sediminis]
MKTYRSINKHFPVVVAAFTSVLLLSGCGPAPSASETDSSIQAVKLARVVDNVNITSRTFPAEVSAVKTVDASFEVSGRIVYENLVTGQIVKKGEILANIDPTPFEQGVKEARARFDQASRDLTRIQATFKKGLASQAQMDNAITAHELAGIALEKAQQDLSYTTLRAPFDAQVSERLVENNSFVRAGDIIARLQDVSRYYFNVNVPERVLSAHKAGTPVLATASIISAPDKQFSLHYVEHATQPDPITQTYKVVFAADATAADLTPGARATVTVQVNQARFADGVLVPFSAIQGNDGAGFHVWRFNANTSQVNRVKVDVLHIENNFALISGDVSQHDKVVSAGASKMREGLIVKPYTPEQ